MGGNALSMQVEPCNAASASPVGTGCSIFGMRHRVLDVTYFFVWCRYRSNQSAIFKACGCWSHCMQWV